MPQFRGKDLLIHDAPPSSYAQLVNLLAGLNVRDGLRYLGKVFAAVDATPNKHVTINEVLVPTFAIPPLALELVLSSNDTNVGQLDDAHLAQLVRCFHGLPWPSTEGDGVTETLLRMSEAQFSFQKRDPYKLERTLRIFKDIWPTVPLAKHLDIQHVTNAKFGLDLEDVLALGFAFSKQAYEQGYVSPYIIESSHPMPRAFREESQYRFLKSLSIGYADIRRRADNIDFPEELRKFRFNPIALYPLVLPDIQPPLKAPVYLVPCAKLLLDRITDGLIHDCREQFGNNFNESFGHVIQRYVGDLLIETYGSQCVRGDFDYRVGKRKLRSPDWTVFGNGCAVVAEVKKTLLRQRDGGLNQVRKYLKNTLQKAVSQLANFRAHLPLDGSYPSMNDVEFVVVAWDDTWWANSIMMHLVHRVPEDLHIHVISMRELEILLAQSESPDALYQTLRSKRRAGVDGAEMDMADWLARLPGGGIEKRQLASFTRIGQDFLACLKDRLENA